MKSIIRFQISESDGGYVAEGVSVPIVTQGETLDELAANIREAVGLYTGDHVARITKRNRHGAIDWGRPVGKEVW